MYMRKEKLQQVTYNLAATPSNERVWISQIMKKNKETKQIQTKQRDKERKKDKDIVDKTYPQRLCTPNFQNEFYIEFHAIKLTIARENKILVLTYDVCIWMKSDRQER